VAPLDAAGGGSGIHAQVFGPDGVARGPGLLAAGGFDSPAIAARPGSAYLVWWWSSSGTGARRVAPNGTTAAPQITLATHSDSLTLPADDRLLRTWINSTLPPVHTQGQFLEPDGTPSGDAFPLEPDGAACWTRIAPLGGSGFAGLQSCDPAGTRVQVFDAQGTPVGSGIALDDSNWVRILGLPGGGFGVFGDSLVARFFSAAGDPAGGFDTPYGAGDLAVRPGGNVLGVEGSVAREVTPTGPVGPMVDIGTELTPVGMGSPRVATLPDDTWVVVWAKEAIYAQRFDAKSHRLYH